MKISNTIGIDVSKEKLDVYDYCQKSHLEFDNSNKGINKILKWVKKANKSMDDILICFEHTGLYSFPLAEFLSKEQVIFTMVPGLEIKRSMGMARGKNDKVDSMQIAKYAFLRKDEIEPYKLPSNSVLTIKRLLSLRHKMVRQRGCYKAALGEMKRVLKTKDNIMLFSSQQAIITSFTKQISAIEKEIREEVRKDQRIDELYKLVTSVKGVGFVLGLSFIVYTNAFTSFDTWRQFACYSGIAPFDYQSGSSIRSPRRVNHMANKKLKGLLSNAASSCIQYSPEMRTYYEKRLEMGKNKMSTQNIIRNKIVARVFAVVKRGTPYVDTMKYAA